MRKQVCAWAWKAWRNWAKPLLIVVVVTCSFRSAIADWNDVPSGSMRPTIVEGDRVFVNKLAYDLKVPFTTWHLAEWAGPQRSDVVILYAPDTGTRLVKRVVGVAGDRIEMRDGKLLLNGESAEYEPVDLNVRYEIEPSREVRQVLATETVGEDSHSVLMTPGVRERRTFAPLTVPDGHYFVMGDNRDISRDSRAFGCVPRRLVVGEVLGVAFSLDRGRYYRPRWERFFHRLR